MFEADAARLARFHWPRVGTDHIGRPATTTSLAAAVHGMSLGLNMLAEESAALLQERSIPLRHANLFIRDYREGAPPFDPLSTATTFGGTWGPTRLSNPAGYLNTSGKIVDGAGAVVEGPLVVLPARRPEVLGPDAQGVNLVGLIAPAILTNAIYSRNPAATQGPINFFSIAHFSNTNTAATANIPFTDGVAFSFNQVIGGGNAIGSDMTIRDTSSDYVGLASVTARRVSAPGSGGSGACTAATRQRTHVIVSVKLGSEVIARGFIGGLETVTAPNVRPSTMTLPFAKGGADPEQLSVNVRKSRSSADYWVLEHGFSSLTVAKLP